MKTHTTGHPVFHTPRVSTFPRYILELHHVDTFFTFSRAILLGRLVCTVVLDNRPNKKYSKDAGRNNNLFPNFLLQQTSGGRRRRS